MNTQVDQIVVHKNIATRWGQLVNGDHIVSTRYNTLGIDGNRDILVRKDAYSGLKAAYPMPDKADLTADAITDFMGEQNLKVLLRPLRRN